MDKLVGGCPWVYKMFALRGREGTCCRMKLWTEQLDSEAIADMRRWREQLHRIAELGFAEHRTAAFLIETLKGLGPDELTEGIAGTGLVALFRGGRPGPCIAVRAELDALPITEATGLPYASVTPGVMHACGHDGHMAISLGLAAWLSAHKEELAGSVKLIFQPAEEDGGGGAKMVDWGVLKDPVVDFIFALHARPEIKAGQIELDDVPNAYADGFDIRIKGASGHGGYPHIGRDAVVMASQLVMNLQQVVSRRSAPVDPVVLSIGRIQAGTARNVIADEAVLGATIRTRCPDVRRRVFADLERISKETAAAFGGTAELQHFEGYPRVVNDPTLLSRVRELASDLLGEDRVLTATEATMGGDDFGFYLEEAGGVPGCSIRLGVESNASLHTGGFDFGHEALASGTLLLINLIGSF